VVVYRSLALADVETEESFWAALSSITSIGKVTHSSAAFEELALRPGKRLCLILDEMDTMLANQDVTSTFMEKLRAWQGSPFVTIMRLTSILYFGFLQLTRMQ
jgi:hypothetical protein